MHKVTAEESWEGIYKRLTTLNYADESEEGLLCESYESLIQAYQESRSLNLEMEELLNDWINK